MFEWMKSNTEEKTKQQDVKPFKSVKQMGEPELFDATFNRLVDLDKADNDDLDEFLHYVRKVFLHISVVAMRQFLDPEVGFKRTGNVGSRDMEQCISDCSNLELDINHPIFNKCPVKLSLSRSTIADDPTLFFYLSTTEYNKDKLEKVRLFNDPKKDELISRYDTRIARDNEPVTDTDPQEETGLYIKRFIYSFDYVAAKVSWTVRKR